VRKATEDSKIFPETVQQVITRRFGDKVCIANPRDRRSIEEAITHGYRVVSGAELSGKEWLQVKEAKAMQSSSELFGTSFTDCKVIPENEWSEAQKVVVAYAKMIAKECLDKDITVEIIKSQATVSADYGKGHLRFNASRLPASWWAGKVCEATTDLIIHELGHEGGQHYEHGYHEVLTKVGAKLTMLALNKPEVFNMKGG
jgi:hypothetical protein